MMGSTHVMFPVVSAMITLRDTVIRVTPPSIEAAPMSA